MWAVRLVVLVAFFDLFLQFPTVAPYAEDLGETAAFVGVIVGAYSFTNLFGNLGAGYVLDRWGRRGPVMIGLAITALAVATYPLAETSGQLLASRAIHGLAAGILAPGAFAIIGDQSAEDRRGRAMGVTGATIAIAAMVGPPAAGILRDAYSATTVFLLDAAVLSITLIVFSVMTRGSFGTKRRDKEVSKPKGRGVPFSSGILVAYSSAFVMTIGLGTLITYLPLALEDLGESAARSGSSFGIFAVIALVVMASPVSRVSDRIGRTQPLIGGLVGIGIGLIALGTIAGYGGVAVGMAIFGLGFGLVFPAATALVAESTGADRRGTAFGVFYAVYSMGVVIGSVGSGTLAEIQGDTVGVPFLASAVIALAAIPVVWMFRAGGKNVKRQP